MRHRHRPEQNVHKTNSNLQYFKHFLLDFLLKYSVLSVFFLIYKNLIYYKKAIGYRQKFYAIFFVSVVMRNVNVIKILFAPQQIDDLPIVI